MVDWNYSLIFYKYYITYKREKMNRKILSQIPQSRRKNLKITQIDLALIAEISTKKDRAYYSRCRLMIRYVYDVS